MEDEHNFDSRISQFDFIKFCQKEVKGESQPSFQSKEE
jgi:hypothetical protein